MPSAISPDQATAVLRQRLAHLGGLSARTGETERAIMEAAEDRLKAIDADRDKLRNRVHSSATAADEYERLTLERGQCQLVIAQAREHLGR